MRLFDALQMTSAPVIDDNGNMLVVSRSARTGTQVYTGASVGRPDMQWAVGYRPAEEVFAKDSLDSYTAIPVTIEHPAQFVDAESWKDVAVGETDGAIKDGEFIRVPFTVRHAKAVKSIRDGKSQISMGYSADLDWTAGVTDSGENYDFIMRNLRMNHLAIVDAARGGPLLNIGDNEPTTKKETKVPHILHDGLKVDLSDAEAVQALVSKLVGDKAASDTRADKAEADLADAQTKAATDATANVTAIEAKDAEIATLTAEKATLTQQLADAQSPERLKDAAAAYAKVVDAATKMGVTVDDGMKEADIRKAAVSAKLGDVAANWTEAQIAVSFDTLAASVKDAAPTDPYRRQMGDRKAVDFSDASTASRNARQEMIDAMKNRSREDAE